MSEIIVIASGKGGVGKTTVTANIGAVLSHKSNKVIIVDTDMGLRNLDVALGLENNVVYDALDVINGVCSITKAAIQKKGYENLYLLPGIQTGNSDSINPEQMNKLCHLLSQQFDYVLLDSPAGLEKGFYNAAQCADSAIVVTEPFTASIRDADKTIDAFESIGIKNIKLIINGIRVDYIKKGITPNVDDIVDVLGVPILGIIPYDEHILYCAGQGCPVMEIKDAPSAVAFDNIAKRLMGEYVPIMDMETKTSFFEKITKVFKRTK